MAFRERQADTQKSPLRSVAQPLEIEIERTTRPAPTTRRELVQRGALTLGILGTVVGVAGFLAPLVVGGDPGLFTTSPGLLFGVFGIDGRHALVHLVVGLAGIVFSRKVITARRYLWSIGAIFAVLAIMGFADTTPGLHDMAGITVNDADDWMHAVLALAALGVLYLSRRGGRWATS